jgi:cell division protease FtsH
MRVIKRQKKILKDNKTKLDHLAQGLLEYETLTGDEIIKVMDGNSLNKSDDIDSNNDGSSSSITSVPKSGKKPPKKKGGLEPQTST